MPAARHARVMAVRKRSAPNPWNTRERRGYGTAHKRLRERYRLVIDGGAVVLCARCRRRILAGEPGTSGIRRIERAGPALSTEAVTAQQVQRNGATVTNSRRKLQEAPDGTSYARVWSRVWEWPIPPDVYVDPQVVSTYLADEARRDPEKPQKGE